MKDEIKKIDIIDLFAGAGGLSNGFEQTGRFKVVGAIEINKAAQKTFIANHGYNPNIIIKDTNNESDITKINFKKMLKDRKLKNNNLIVIGGPPCQGFSNVNRQKNYIISGNNQLIKEFVRAINEINPIAFLMENVKTIDSKIHKLFITKNLDENKYSYSTITHLQKIAYCEKDKFWGDDKIEILESEFKEILPIFKKIIMKNNNIFPIITNVNMLARIRSINRKIKKTNKFSLNQKEVKELKQISQQLLSLLIDSKDNEWIYDVGLSEIIMNSVELIKNLVSTEEEFNTFQFKKTLGPLFDLNTFLLRLVELYEENIYLRDAINIRNNQSSLIIEVGVLSYSVVDYLERVFSYFGYEFDKKVVTASNFGVPQKRNRFFMLGVRRDRLLKNRKVELPEKNDSILTPYTTRDAIQDLECIAPQNEIVTYNAYCYPHQQNFTSIQSYYRKGVDSSVLHNHINTKSRDLSKQRFEAIKEMGGKNFHSLSTEFKKNYTDISRTQNTVYLRLNYDEPAPTVINVRKSMWNHPVNAVALSIREAARLQSFRDSFVFKGNKDQQYQQVGNAVPPILARSIAEKLLSLIGENPLLTISDELSL